MTSREWFDYLEKHLNEKGFHIRNQSIGNGYFIFDMGNESVIHFDIKENRGWRFEIWFEFDETDREQIVKATFFARHKDDLNKFKPSRSYFKYEYVIKSGVTIDEYKDWDFDYIPELCNQIKQHPFLSYCIDDQNSYIGGYGFVEGNILLSYVKRRCYYFKEKIKDWYDNKATTINLTWLKLQRIKNGSKKLC